MKLICVIMLIFLSCGPAAEVNDTEKNKKESSFSEDVAFLRKYTDILVLEDSTGNGKIAVSPALQGRVMTSTARGDTGSSYGWINRALFESGDTSEHINAFGGEERFWMGPEGGQFSIFFEKGKEFNLDNWFTPRIIDLEPFDLMASSKNMARFTKTAEIKNYSGTLFKIKIDREISVFDSYRAYQMLGVQQNPQLNLVAFHTKNILQNIGESNWSKEGGILSIWLLGMLKPSPYTTIVIPFNERAEETGSVVNDTYFGKVPAERLKIDSGVIFFRGDGQYRSKIGLSPTRARDVFGSYDSKTHTLTIVKYNKPGTTDYVNSTWEIQDHPFRGDVINSYNDGPPSPGVKPMGPFYELETSSPALELQSGENVVHTQTTFHIQGDEKLIDHISTTVLGVSLERIRNAFSMESE